MASIVTSIQAELNELGRSKVMASANDVCNNEMDFSGGTRMLYSALSNLHYTYLMAIFYLDEPDQVRRGANKQMPRILLATHRIYDMATMRQARAW